MDQGTYEIDTRSFLFGVISALCAVIFLGVLTTMSFARIENGALKEQLQIKTLHNNALQKRNSNLVSASEVVKAIEIMMPSQYTLELIKQSEKIVKANASVTKIIP